MFHDFIEKKTGMKNQLCHKELGATVACAMHIGEGTMQVKEARITLKETHGLVQLKLLQ